MASAWKSTSLWSEEGYATTKISRKERSCQTAAIPTLIHPASLVLPPRHCLLRTAKAAIPKLLALCYGRNVDLREELLIKLRIYHYFLDNYFLGRNGCIT